MRLGTHGPKDGRYFATDDLWVGTLGGLTRWHQGRLTSFTAKEGLQDDLITGLAEDPKGTLWVATKQGWLSRFDGTRFVTVRVAGTPTEIDALAADALGFLWLRGRHGIARVSAAALLSCKAGAACSPAVNSYGTGDGMPNDEVAGNGQPAIANTRSGELWFGTRKGVAVTNPAQLPFNPIPPPVVIESFLVDDVQAGPGVRIPYGHARYTFRYAGLSFTNPAKVRYRFKLEGFDRDWTSSGSQRTAYYTNLSPRQYRFQVEAANNDGVWSTSAAEVSFSVLPPFYRRWWFYSLVLAGVLSFTVLMYLMRVRRLERQFRVVLAERNRMAREIHDTLAQDFVGVSLQLDLLAQLLNRRQVEEAAEQVRQTRTLVKTGLAAARQSIWNLRANVTRDTLPARLTVVVERFSRPACRSEIRIGGAYRPLERSVEDEVLRITQEALSNVDRHAAASMVGVDLRYDQDGLVLIVTDNGKGFEVAEALPMNGHYGLKGMQERAENLHAKLTMRSSPREGSTITLTVPLSVLRRRSE